MNAEIGIDDSGRPCIWLTDVSHGEFTLLGYLMPWLPIAPRKETAGFEIVGDRLPGSGKGG